MAKATEGTDVGLQDEPETTDFDELWEQSDEEFDEDHAEDAESDSEGDGGEDDVGDDDDSPRRSRRDADSDDDDEEDEEDEEAEDDEDDEDEEDEEDESASDFERDLKAAKERTKIEKERAAEEEKGKVWKIPVNGVVHEVTEEQLVREYGTSVASSERFQEGKQMRQEAEAFYRAYAGEDTAFEALVDHWTNKLGDRTKAREKIRDMALEWMQEDLEGAMITDPREKNLWERERRLRDEQIQREKKEKRERRAREEKAYKRFVDDVVQGFEGELKRTALPDEKGIWRALTALVDEDLRSGAKREEILGRLSAYADRVVKNRQLEAHSLVKTLAPEELEKMFPDQIKVIKEGGKKERIEKVRAKKKTKKAGAARGKRRRKKQGWVDIHDAFEDV